MTRRERAGIIDGGGKIEAKATFPADHGRDQAPQHDGGQGGIAGDGPSGSDAPGRSAGGGDAPSSWAGGEGRPDVSGGVEGGSAEGPAAGGDRGRQSGDTPATGDRGTSSSDRATGGHDDAPPAGPAGGRPDVSGDRAAPQRAERQDAPADGERADGIRPTVTAVEGRPALDDTADRRVAAGPGTDEPARDTRDDSLTPLEQYERERVVSLPNAVGFRFGEAEPPAEEMDRLKESFTPEERAALDDPDAYVLVQGQTSRTGSESFNAELSQRRADEVKEQLEESGVRARIEAVGLGEAPAKDAGVLDGQDAPDDRIATVEIHPANFEFEGDVIRSVPLLDARWEKLDADIERGEQLREELLGQAREAVREVVRLADNPISFDSTDARGGLGTLVKAGVWLGIETMMAPEAVKQVEPRRGLYSDFAKGVAKELDPTHEPMVDGDEVSQVFYQAGREAAKELDQVERYQLGVALIEQERRPDSDIVPQSRDHFGDSYHGVTFERALQHRAGSQEYLFDRRTLELEVPFKGSIHL